MRWSVSVSVTAITHGGAIEHGISAIIPLTLACVLATIHLVGHRLRWLDGTPRSSLLSAAGGAAVAYVFVHLLPELEHARRTIEESGSILTALTEYHVYLLSLGGFVTFYGLERFARVHRSQHPGDGQSNRLMFRVHVGAFTLYNGIIGYLLIHRQPRTATSLVLFALAMGLHLLVNDHGLWEHHRGRYVRVGRWILAAAVIGGAVVGFAVEPHPGILWTLFAFLGGAVVLNTIKEELPKERESHFWSFAVGAGGYAGLLLLV